MHIFLNYLVPPPLQRRSSLSFSPIKKGQQTCSMENEEAAKPTEITGSAQSHGVPQRRTSFITQTFIELSPARKSSVTNASTSSGGLSAAYLTSSLEKLSKGDGVNMDSVERVTFATEALKLTDAKGTYRILYRTVINCYILSYYYK